MHHALQIEEILLNIFAYCCTLVRRWPPVPSGWQCWYANADLAVLARTCRTFKEPALDMIWAELNDLTPLVRCIPETSWAESDGVYSLKKHLEQNEWDIILGYTRRVRALPRLHGSLGLAGDCIEALSTPPTSVQSIFPNLRVVGLSAPNATISPLARHLAHPNLTSISFEHVESLGAVTEAFGEQCPLVTDFHISLWGHADTISGLVCRWQNLRSVKSYNVGLNVDALSHLSRLRNLRHVSFKVYDAVVDRIYATKPSSPTLTFPALDSVRLTSDSLTPIWRLLRRFRLPAMHDLSVGHHAHRPTAPDLMSFFVALQDACTHNSLNNLLLRTCHFDNESHMEDVSSYYITFNRLRPLTVFVNIKSITLDVPCGADLNERELLCLASSWPHLERFEVGKHYDWTASSAITPGGFLQLLERCRSLRVFYFMFDTCGYTEIPQGHPWRGLTMPQGTFIHVLNSPIEEASVEALGVFFHVAPYPDFNLTTHWNNRYFRGGERPRELCDLYYRRWAEARSLALELWKERRELRHSLEIQHSACHAQ